MTTYYDRAAILPGRSSTRSKAPGQLWPIGEGPHYARAGNGARLRCDDGRWYTDMLCALGAVSLGYGESWQGEIIEGVTSLPQVSEILAAEAVLEHVAPWASSVRFVRTGSEATHGALMVARRATGRQVVHRLRGSYHGWHEQWQEGGSSAVRDVYYFSAGDIPNARNTAAVIIEPPRWEIYNRDWLRAVVDAAHSAGALVIFDEMIYGGRWALGGATEYFAVKPDIACFGKALGNGAPVGIIVGNEALAEHGECISGTYSGDAHAAWSLIGTLDAYKEHGVIEHMWARGEQLQAGLRDAVAASSIDAHVEGAPVHQRIRFDNPELGPAFSAEMVKRGIIWHPQCTNIMLAHTEAIIDEVIEAAAVSLEAMNGR